MGAGISQPDESAATAKSIKASAEPDSSAIQPFPIPATTTPSSTRLLRSLSQQQQQSLYSATSQLTAASFTTAAPFVGSPLYNDMPSSLSGEHLDFDTLLPENIHSLDSVMARRTSALAGTIEGIPTLIQWSKGGQNVYITGTFNQWRNKVKLVKSGSDFSTVLYLQPGDYQCKFIVDDEWRCSDELMMAPDVDGNLVNHIHVDTDKDFYDPNAESTTLAVG
jgi:hypothetical protein